MGTLPNLSHMMTQLTDFIAPLVVPKIVKKTQEHKKRQILRQERNQILKTERLYHLNSTNKQKSIKILQIIYSHKVLN